MNKLLHLQRFRQDLYQVLGPARDALFELTDAVLTTPAAPSFAHLSLAPLFRRRWPSLYEALQDGDPPRDELLRLALRYVPEAALDEPVLIGDHTAWPRLSASRMAERTYEHHPTRAQRVSQGEPITRGLGYTTLALLPEPSTPWVLPLLHERIEPSSSPLESAAEALRRACQALSQQGAGVPITLWDSEYGCAPFLELTHDVPCSKLMRLRANRCLYGAPPEYQGRGRPFRHGPVFRLKDEATWPEPEEMAYFYDVQWGWVYLRLWRHLHFREAPDRELTLVCVERQGAPGTRRHPRLMWLAWVGAGAEPSLRRLWQLYTRRFSIEHFYRLAKGRLYWTLPRFSTVEQSDRWSRLLVPLLMELYLARAVVADRPLPWQRSQRREAMTPGRVLQGISGVIALIGTPAMAPKRRGKSPGWPAGRVRTRRARSPAVRKSKRRRAQARSRAA